MLYHVHWNRLDLNLPLPNLLRDIKDEIKVTYPLWRDREFWQKEIDAVAPGYLELQAQGRESDFDLGRLMELD
ncbi:hypothetical protein BDV06DRAFT_195214, partial [Aspergillus oleicola]